MGGQTSIRPYWRCYYANTAAVVFVIDSTDIERLNTAAEELSAMLNEDELRDANLLVFANKQDQPGAKGAGEISEALRLGELRDRNWSIVACSAIDGSGVEEGMDWLVVCIFAGHSACLLTRSDCTNSWTANHQYRLMNITRPVHISSIPHHILDDPEVIPSQNIAKILGGLPRQQIAAEGSNRLTSPPLQVRCKLR